MIVDANEKPGGLASTDVTPEGFVSLPWYNIFPLQEYKLMSSNSSTMLEVTLSSHIINILMIALTKHFLGKGIGIPTNAFLMFVVKDFGFRTPSKIISPYYQKKIKLGALKG
jgi:hypothetical protein